MEDLRLDLMRKTAVIEEEDDAIYEDIEAPKFVDFTIPDRSRSDDSSWFCVRIGCDQNHELVDPEALHKNFVLRVMAARSPNVRRHKSLYRSAAKCPHSAPAKQPRSRIMRLSTATSIPDKMANTKIKNHLISSLRSTPTQPKTRAQAPTVEKALTTPRNRKSLVKQEPFLSAKYQKAPIAAPRNGTVVKALFANVSKEATENTTAIPESQISVSDVCAKMRKLNLASKKKTVPSRYLSSIKSSKRGNESEMDTSKKGVEPAVNPKKNMSCLRKCSRPALEEKTQIGLNRRKIPPPSGVSSAKESRELNTAECASSNDLTTEKSKEDSGSKPLVLQDSKNVEHVNEFDDNKENVLNTDQTRDVNSIAMHYEIESFQARTSENVPHKVIKAQLKSHGNSDHGVKQRKTTNPKPFRLRTDERGILKEANSERRRFQIEPQKETKTAFGHGDVIQKNQKLSQRRSEPARQVEETKLILSKLQMQKLETCKEKVAEKPKKETLKRIITKTARPTSRLEKDKRIKSSSAAAVAEHKRRGLQKHEGKKDCKLSTKISS